MKYFTILLIALTMGCGPSGNRQESRKINTDEMESLINSDQDIQLVDIRTEPEIVQGYIGEAIFIDFKQDGFKEALNRLEKEKTLVMYCASGRRSGLATKIAEELGFTYILDYTDGFNGWAGAEKPISY